MSNISPAAYNRPNFYQNHPDELQNRNTLVDSEASKQAQSVYFAALNDRLNAYKTEIQAWLAEAGSPVALQARLSQILSQLQPEVRTIISQAPGGAEGLAAAAKQVGQFFFDMSQGLENPTQLEAFFTALYQQLDGIPGVLREVERQRNRALSRKIADQKASEKNKALALPQQASPAPRPISATDYPSPHQTARTRAIQILKEQYELSDVDPDKVTVQFVETKALHLLLGMPTPLGMQAALDPQQHSASRRFPSMSLTDALIKHFEQNKLGTFESIHDADHPGLGAANVRMFYEDSAKIRQHLDPKKAAAAVSATDLKASYLAAVEQFWTTHQEALNAQQTQLMRKAIAYQTARNTLSELSANFLTQQLDQRTSSAQLLSMDGYPSTDLLVFRLSDSDRVILYIPAELQAFHEFKDDDQLKNWVMARLVLENHNNTSGAPGNPEDLREARRILATISGFFSKKTDTSEEWVGDSHGFSSSTKLLTHFKGENRIAGLDYFVKSIGMEIVNSGSRMPQLRRSDKSLSERAGYFKAGVTFDAVPSTQSQLPIGKLLAIRQKEHHTEEAYQIVSNSDVYRHRATEWLNYLEQLAMVALIPVAPELSLPALAGISASKLGLSAADLYYAHDEEERSQAVLGIAAESSNLLQLAIAAGAGKIIGSVSGDSKTVEASLSDASKIDEIRPQELPHPDTTPKPRESAVKPTPRVEEATPPRLAQELNGLSVEGISLAGKMPEADGTYLVGDKLYISVEDKAYEIQYSRALKNGRIVNQSNRASRGIPVRFENGKWVSNYEEIGLPGGGPCLSRQRSPNGSLSIDVNPSNRVGALSPAIPSEAMAQNSADAWANADWSNSRGTDLGSSRSSSQSSLQSSDFPAGPATSLEEQNRRSNVDRLLNKMLDDSPALNNNEGLTAERTPFVPVGLKVDQEIPAGSYLYRIDSRTPNELLNHGGFQAHPNSLLPGEMPGLDPVVGHGFSAAEFPGAPAEGTRMGTSFDEELIDIIWHASGTLVPEEDVQFYRFSGNRPTISIRKNLETPGFLESPEHIPLVQKRFLFDKERIVLGQVPADQIEYYSASKKRWIPLQEAAEIYADLLS